ncbi:MAG: MBL fold metallo-hydrolase, partial [Verrucomicrobia bacterium]|nr:MBL fold metallo-hydrolase [Verrucomicrobiota bacterium]
SAPPMSSPHLVSPTRRQFLTTSATALAATALTGGLSAAETKPAAPAAKPPRNAFAYRFAIGDLEAWSISDGNLALKEGLGLMWPEGDRPAMKADMVAHGERTDLLPLYVNILVVKVGNEVALFDGGFGPGKNPNSGWVGESLAAIGLAPEKVTHAFLSHAHADHIGGFVTGNRMIFPNAAFHCLKAELDFWRSPEPDFSKSKRAKGPLPGMIKDAREKFDVLQPNLQLVKPGDGLLGGAIQVVAGPGHTAGHALFRVRSGQESLMHFMDVAHHHTLMFTDPGWGIAFDHEPELAIDTRKKLFAELSTTHERAYGFHLPWPGLGRVAKAGPGYAWQGERWSWGI